MKAPGFWFERPGFAALALHPLSLIWTLGARRRAARGPGVSVDVPVICVGNVTVGGSGKTPAVIALAEALRDAGRVPFVLSRGYGGRLDGPVEVDPARHDAGDVGDEPLLLAAFARVWVAKDRVAGARAAVAAGADVIVMDDGFQDPTLAKDLSIVVVDGETGWGNGRVLPAGPLREPVADGLARADAVLVVGGGDFAPGHGYDGPVARARIAPLQTGMDWAGLKVLAFAGIGRPDKFFATLDSLGAHIVARHAFGDHAPYRGDLLRRLKAEATKLGAQLVTTEKDQVRLPAEFRRDVLTLPVRMTFDAEAGILELIRNLHK